MAGFKKMKKAFAPIVLVVILLFLAGLIIFIRLKNNPIKNADSSSVSVVATSTPLATPSVPLLTEEDTVRLFFRLINDKQASEAVKMLSGVAAPDDSARQAWGVNFNAIKSVQIKSLEKAEENQFKVILDMSMKNGAAYNWVDGENLRWINLVKEENVWKIDAIATGP